MQDLNAAALLAKVMGWQHQQVQEHVPELQLLAYYMGPYACQRRI
jgi:hypothetical protein